LSDWDKAVGMMPIDNQTRAVELKLKELNPQATDLSVQGNVVDGLVKVLWVREVQNVADISPIRALRHLTELLIVGHRGKLTDLSPLKGMKLTHFEVIGQPVRDISPLKGMPIRTISLWMWLGDDLSPLRGMPIIHGNFGGHNLRELEPLRGMKLEMACFNFSQVSDLSPLRGMPLTRLEIANTQVTDLTPIANMQLDFLAAQDTSIGSFAPLMGSKITELNLNYDEARDRYVLEALPGLRTVNNRPVAEVLAK
jgi:Leucine-rich repeat (LRR) protein